MTTSLLLEYFNDLLSTPEDVELVNRVIVQLALQGKLVKQDPNDEPANELVKRLQKTTERKIQPLDSNDEPYQLPNGWLWFKTGDIYEIVGGGTPSTKVPEYWDGNIPWITSADILEPKVIRIRKTITDAALEHSTTNLVPAKSIIVVTRVGLGKVGITNVPLCFSQDSHALIENSAFIYPDFALYCLLEAAQSFREKSRGTTIFGITRPQLENVPFPLPPYQEQIRITHKIEELFAQTRALAKELDHSQIELDGLNKSALSHLLASETPEEFNQHWDFIAEHFDLLFQTPEHVAPLRQSILELAVRGKLTRREAGDESAGELLKSVQDEKARLIEEGKLKKEKPLPPIEDDEKDFELPKGWEWVRLGDISKLSDYGTSEKASVVDQVPVLRMNNIQSGRVLLENLKYVPASLEELPKLYLKNGDLLFNRTNSYELVGKTGIFKGEDDKYTFASYLIRVSFFQNFVNIDYINSYFNSDACRLTQIEPHITQQTGQANFNGTKLKNIVIPLPPLAEQERIVKRVEQLLSLCDALEARLQSAEEERGMLVRAVMSTVGGSDGE